MTDRMCSLCGEYYCSETGHNYDICVSKCSDYLEKAKVEAHNAIDRLITAYSHYHEAVHIQKQDWWKKEKKL